MNSDYSKMLIKVEKICKYIGKQMEGLSTEYVCYMLNEIIKTCNIALRLVNKYTKKWEK